MSPVVIGVDIAKAKFDVARLADGNYRHRAFDNTPEGFARFAGWLAGFKDASPAVCMEATGAYGVPLAEWLAAHGFRASVVNPAKIAAFAKSELGRAKTDKADAKLIARYCAVMRPPAWTPPPREIRALQAVLWRLLQLDGIERIRGFALPKFGPHSLGDWLRVWDDSKGHDLLPILETAETFDHRKMEVMRDRLEDYGLKDRVLCLRIGGNDLLNLLGIRRSRGATVYDTPLRGTIADLVRIFHPAGYRLSAGGRLTEFDQPFGVEPTVGVAFQPR